MRSKLVLTLISMICTCGSALACISPNPALSDKLAANPHYFGADNKNSYQSGSEVYLIPDRLNSQFTFFEGSEINLDFCSTVRIVDAQDKAYGGLTFWFANVENYHTFYALADGRFGVTESHGGQLKPIAVYDPPQALQRSAQYELEVQTIGSKATVLVNGVQLGTLTDDGTSGNAHRYGFMANGDQTRPIFAFSRPSAAVIHGVAGNEIDQTPNKPEPPETSADASNAGDDENPNIGKDVKPIYEAMRFYASADAADFFPDKFKLQSVIQPAGTAGGSSDMVFHYVAEDETSEFVLRFFPSKELAANYWADGKDGPLFKEASELGPALTAGSQPEKDVDGGVGYLAGTSTDKRMEWVRSFANTGSLIYMVTTQRQRHGRKSTSAIEKSFISETTGLLAEAVSAINFNVGLMGGAFINDGDDKTPEKK